MHRNHGKRRYAATTSTMGPVKRELSSKAYPSRPSRLCTIIGSWTGRRERKTRSTCWLAPRFPTRNGPTPRTSRWQTLQSIQAVVKWETKQMRFDESRTMVFRFRHGHEEKRKRCLYEQSCNLSVVEILQRIRRYSTWTVLPRVHPSLSRHINMSVHQEHCQAGPATSRGSMWNVWWKALKQSFSTWTGVHDRTVSIASVKATKTMQRRRVNSCIITVE